LIGTGNCGAFSADKVAEERSIFLMDVRILVLMGTGNCGAFSADKVEEERSGFLMDMNSSVFNGGVVFASDVAVESFCE
jgi:hypothetical protein